MGFQYLLNMLLRQNVSVSNSVYKLQKFYNIESDVQYPVTDLENGKFKYFSIQDNLEFCFEAN